MSRNKHILAKLPPPMSTPWLLDPVFGEVLCCRSVSVHNQPSLRSRTANSYPDSASANERLRVDLHLGHTPLLRSEEHMSELQSQFHLVCRLLLEKKKKKKFQLLHYKNKRKNKQYKINKKQ